MSKGNVLCKLNLCRNSFKMTIPIPNFYTYKMPKSKKKIITFSANAVFSNEGLLTEILLRVPVKSLVRCRCVSKKWCSLISSPHFTRFRIPRFTPASGIFLYHSFFKNPFHKFVPFSLKNPIPAPIQKFPFLQHDHHSPKIFISQSCNGLLLCRTFHNPFTFNENYYIFNPTTQQFITLPRPPSGDVIGMSLAFDPWKSPHYKVICLRISELEPANHQIEIYSSETKKWRVSGSPFPRRHDTSFKHGLVYWNGAIYVSCSVRFNVEREEFEKFPMPDFTNGQEVRHNEEDHRIVYFGESYGHLHLIQVNRQRLALNNIYEMKLDGTGWFLKYEVNLEDVVLAFPRIIRRYLQTTDFHYYAMAVLTVVRGEKEEDSFLALHIPEMAILRYNLVNKSFHKLCDFGNGILEEFDEQLAVSLHFHSTSTYQYIESTYCW